MTNPIDELIEKLNALRARATPLPWSWEQCGDKCDAPVVGVSWRDDDETCTSVAGQIQDFDEQGNEVSHYRENIASEWSTGGDGAASANAAFVVEAVNALPILIAALSTLQEQKRKLEEALRESRDVLGAIPAPHSYPLWERMCRAIRKAEIALGGEA